MTGYALQLHEVAKDFGAARVVEDFSLDVADGELIVLVGPSGCGKSTLLRMIAGLEDVSEGAVVIAGQEMNHVPPGRRGIAMVFQNYALYPHMTVAQNMGFALRNERLPASEIERRVDEAADKLKIGQLLSRKPAQLSGGQRQRVAIGRAIVREPDVFLFDEPLSNLDAALRVQTRVEIAKLHADLGNTIIYVTHDQVEAMTLADRIVVMNAGRVEQIGTPEEIYTRPRSRFVAAFIGTPMMNFIDGRVADGRFTSGSGLAVALPPRLSAADGPAVLGIRPEHLRIAGSAAWEPALHGRLQVQEYLGERMLMHVALDHGPEVVATGAVALPQDETVRMTFDHEHLHLFDPQGRALGAVAGTGAC